MRPFPVRRPRDTQVDLAGPDFEVAGIASGTFARVVDAAREEPDETIELSVADVELVNLAPREPSEVSVTEVTLVKLAAVPAPEPVELSVSDVEVVQFLPAAQSDPMNPFLAFERTFAAGITNTPPPWRAPVPAYAYAASPIARVVEARPETPPASWPVPMPAPRSTPPPRARRRSLIPKATLLMAIVVASGLVSDGVKAGRFRGVTSRASSIARSALAMF